MVYIFRPQSQCICYFAKKGCNCVLTLLTHAESGQNLINVAAEEQHFASDILMLRKIMTG